MSRDLDDLLASDESVVLETRQHWFVVLRNIAVRVLALALLAVAIWYVGDAGWLDNDAGTWLSYAIWVVFALVVLTVLWTLLGWLTERFYVTTSKIVYAYGILNRNVTSTPLVKIDEMTLRRPLLGRMLGFGRLDVENAAGGSEPLAGLEYLPKPVKLYQLISERSRNQRMVEGGAHRDEDNDGLVDREPRRAELEPERDPAPEPTPAPEPEIPPKPTTAQADALREGLGSWKPTGDATSGPDAD
jgi:membrane protein YdbS with pleckstrin-like domain